MRQQTETGKSPSELLGRLAVLARPNEETTGLKDVRQTTSNRQRLAAAGCRP
jgi:hypothetical protein